MSTREVVQEEEARQEGGEGGSGAVAEVQAVKRPA